MGSRASDRSPTVVARLATMVVSTIVAAMSLHGGQDDGLDPAAWGEDHIGMPIPDYVTGDECLFCHRNDVGPSWRENPHQRTVRALDRESAAFRAVAGEEKFAMLVEEATAEMGGELIVRFLKPNGRYGQYALLGAAWRPGSDRAHTDGGDGRVAGLDADGWDPTRFGDACAGCHTTAVDSQARAFSSPSLDCYTCHGAVDINHTADTSLIIFSDKRTDPAREVTSICGSCHVRTGRSRSSGLPYADNFVAGDNLFRDFEVDLSDDALALLDASDRHILESIREVTIDGDESVTCLTCHSVHEDSTTRHANLRERPSCFICHFEEGPRSAVREYERHSSLCEY